VAGGAGMSTDQGNRKSGFYHFADWNSENVKIFAKSIAGIDGRIRFNLREGMEVAAKFAVEAVEAQSRGLSPPGLPIFSSYSS
jgi:hypothetical protein